MGAGCCLKCCLLGIEFPGLADAPCGPSSIDLIVESERAPLSLLFHSRFKCLQESLSTAMHCTEVPTDSLILMLGRPITWSVLQTKGCCLLGITETLKSLLQKAVLATLSKQSGEGLF